MSAAYDGTIGAYLRQVGLELRDQWENTAEADRHYLWRGCMAALPDGSIAIYKPGDGMTIEAGEREIHLTEEWLDHVELAPADDTSTAGAKGAGDA